MSENRPVNPSKDPGDNLNRLPAIKIPTVQPLSASTRTWIAGDYPALNRLAGQVYDFARSCNSEVAALASYVERLVGDNRGDWTGPAAQGFRRSFGGDVTLMNDLAQMVVAVGRVVDNLAGSLDGIEASIERMVAPRIEAGDFVWRPKGGLGGGPDQVVASTVSGDDLVVLFGAGAALQRVGQAIHAFWLAALAKAQGCRETAMRQLAVLCAPITKGMDMFTSPDGEQVEREATLLRQDQKDAHNTDIAKLRKAFLAADSDSGITKGDIKKELGNLSELGGDAQTIGGVVADIRAIQHADGLGRLKSGNDALTGISSVVGDLLAVLAVAE